ncbi:MAG: hypothetical protein J6N45_09095 [Alphaproteobacteria bacterium]|nr:hypothetical protein [Alphaproteobacteria bacterium]
MAESIMFRTKDDHIVIMNNVRDDAHKIRLKTLISGQNYLDVLNSVDPNIARDLDLKNTQFIDKYVHRFDYKKRKDEFNNIFENPAENSGRYNSCSAPCLPHLDYDIKTKDIPLDIQALGFSVIPVDNQYEVDDDGKVIGEFSNTRASVRAGTREICVIRNHFKMSPENETLMNDLINRFEKQTEPAINFESTLSGKEKNLFFIYRQELENVQKQKLILHHEFKHVKNEMFFNTVYLNRANYRLSGSDTYRIAVEDERSAFLSLTVNSVNEYLKNGDWDNYDAFHFNDKKLVDTLKAMPASERKTYLMNPKNYIDVSLEFFTKEKQANYDKTQFGGVIKDKVNQTAPNLPEDSGDLSPTFKQIRKQYYHFAVYNPDSGKYEQKYLDEFIDDAHEVVPNATLAQEAKDAYATRQAEYEADVKSGANPNIIDDARKFIRFQNKKTAVVTPDNTYIESLDADWIARHGIANDSASWSNSLQKYFMRQENYVELAKNNEEYTFKLGPDVVRYTNTKNVAIGEDSSFDTYMKVVNAPTARGSAINFRPNLSEEQKLMLFAACVASGRKMKGSIPTDLSGLDRLPGIDAATMAKIKRTLGRTAGSGSTGFEGSARRSTTYTGSRSRAGGYGSR